MHYGGVLGIIGIWGSIITHNFNSTSTVDHVLPLNLKNWLTSLAYVPGLSNLLTSLAYVTGLLLRLTFKLISLAYFSSLRNWLTSLAYVTGLLLWLM